MSESGTTRCFDLHRQRPSAHVAFAPAGLRNLIRLHLPLVDSADSYDNSDGLGIPIATNSRQTGRFMHHSERWAQMAGTAPERDIK